MSNNFSKKIRLTLIFSLTFVSSSLVAYFFEGRFRELVRDLYSFLSNDAISFHHPKKNFFFGTWLFGLAFGFFVVVFLLLVQKKSLKQSMIRIVVGLVVFFATMFVAIYLDGTIKISRCANCTNGKLELIYGQIEYNLLFIASLITALTPFVMSKIKN